jgi:glycosyltransferase involved in cell wall biosynthesis
MENQDKNIAKQKPKVSIITVVFNGEKFIERTIKSIASQTRRDIIEYIIIDGGSKDKTIPIIDNYRDSIDYIISEPDKGIYDAMNKGLAAASGDYVWFMNAGDEIYQMETLQQIYECMDRGVDIIYGEAVFVDDLGTTLGLRSTLTPHKLPDNLIWKDMKYGMVVCHQSFMVKKSIAETYDLRYPYSGDIDWVIRCLKKSRSVVNASIILSKYLIGGHSKKYHVRSLIDRYRVLQHHFGIVQNFINHTAITVRAVKNI